MRKFICYVLLSFCIALVPVYAQDEAVALFKAQCAKCHNFNGDGKTLAAQRLPVPDLRSSEIQKMGDNEIYETIGNGAGHKTYPHTFLKRGLTAVQVRKLVAHIRSLGTRK